MFLCKNWLKNIVTALGIVLWVGALTPEIFTQLGRGCILDENGEELTAEDAEAFMESYFYGSQEAGSAVEIRYRFALLELFN